MKKIISVSCVLGGIYSAQNTRYIGCFLLFLFSAFLPLQAQENLSLRMDISLDFFFDNTEFARSSLTIPQTMPGVNLAPEIGLTWNKSNSLMFGANFLQGFGAANAYDKISPIAYYKYENAFLKTKKPLFTTFYAGVFPRNRLIKNYSEFFFQDSVKYYTPMMHGLFWQVGQSENSFANVWLDWNGKQSDVIHESFFVGFSGYQRFAKYFFVDWQSYMFHFAGTNPEQPNFNVCDNMLGQISTGFHLKNFKKITEWKIAGGILAGFERERGVQQYSPIGFVGQVKIEAYGFGIDNLLYVGDARWKLYNKHATQLYWGSPFLRDKFYFVTNAYWHALNKRDIDGKLSFRFHLSENQLMFEQRFTLQANFGGKLKTNN